MNNSILHDLINILNNFSILVFTKWNISWYVQDKRMSFINNNNCFVFTVVLSNSTTSTQQQVTTTNTDNQQSTSK